MDQIEKETWEPLKKTHPIFNSLVLKIVLSVGVAIYSMVSLSDYSFSYLYGDDRALMVSAALLIFLGTLVLLSIAEALVMTGISVVKWVVRKFSPVKI
jgi:Zn-dependent protease with chaperone function